MYNELNESRLCRALLEEIGCSIDHNQIVIDQDTMQPLKFQGKNIKASMDLMKPVYITESDIKLEPLNRNNLRLISTLFGYFLDKEQMEENIPRVLTFYIEEDKTNDSQSIFRLVVKCEQNIIYISDFYANKCLIYCDLILKIGGSINNQMDLHIFDVY